MFFNGSKWSVTAPSEIAPTPLLKFEPSRMLHVQPGLGLVNSAVRRALGLNGKEASRCRGKVVWRKGAPNCTSSQELA